MLLGMRSTLAFALLVLVAVAAGFGVLTVGLVGTLAVAFVVAMAMATAVRWKLRAGELYDQLGRKRG